MYTIKENLRPVVDFYNDYIDGFELAGLLKFKQQQEIGGDYISKVWRSQEYEINAKYYNTLHAISTPSYTGFIKDNLCRLLLLNGVERLVSACQAAPNLNRIARPNTTSFLFTEIMNDGAFRGTLRGLSMNFLQTSLVLWPSVLITNRSKSGAAQFIGSYLILDALLYPLDTLKNIMYANTAQPLSLRKAIGSQTFLSLYRGILPRVLFNLPFAGALYTTATGHENSWAFWLATIAAYPLNTYKVSVQTSRKSSWGYRGVVPFALVNILCAWELAALATPQKLDQLKQEGARKLNRQ